MLLAVACMAAFSSLASHADTVRVINNPERVVITENDGKVSVVVNGENGNAQNTYTYQSKNKDSEKTDDEDSRDYGVRIPFKKGDTRTGGRWEVFFGGVYLGWGHTNATGAWHGTTGKTFEVGVLNVIGLGYHFGDRNRLSLGMGYQAKYHALKKGYCFADDAQNNVVIANYPANYDHTSSEVLVHTMQVPLLYAKGFGKRCWIYGGGTMNWNFHATYNNHYELENKKSVNETTRKLHQRKISFDMLAGVQWRGLGVYFRYSPKALFKEGYGPELNKSWTVGLSLGF